MIQKIEPKNQRNFKKIKGKSRRYFPSEAPPHPYKYRSPTAFLKTLISDVSMGTKDIDGMHSVEKNYAQAIIKSFVNYKKEGRLTCFPPSRSKQHFQDHFDGKHTLYFTAGRGEHVLVNLDVDCHNRGTPAGAIKYLEYVKEKFFGPNLYCEASTNGKGGHAYFILWTDKFYGEDVADDMKCLQTLLQLDFIENKLDEKFDVEWVEIKGMPMVCDIWNEFEISMGQLAKIPREINTRFDEFRNTTIVNIYDFEDLPAYQKLDPPTRKTLSTKIKQCSSSEITFDWERLGVYEKVANAGLDIMQPKCKNGHRVVLEDAAIFLLLLDDFSNKYKNKSGEMPFKRFVKHWKDAYLTGEIKRAPSNHRITALRNWCSDLGWIDWQDNTYQFFLDGRKGTCCKFSISETCTSLIKQFEITDNSISTTKYKHTHNYVVSENRKDQIRPVLRVEEETNQERLWKLEQEATSICKKYDPDLPILYLTEKKLQSTQLLSAV